MRMRKVAFPLRTGQLKSAAPGPSNGSFFRDMLDRIPHMVWAARPDGTLEYVNNHVVAYAGVQAAEVLGWNWMQFVHPDQQQATIARFRRQSTLWPRSASKAPR